MENGNELQQGFLQEITRILKPGGTPAIVEIEKKETPFGPPLESRYSPEDIKQTIHLTALNTFQVGEHFYMQIFINKKKS